MACGTRSGGAGERVIRWADRIWTTHGTVTEDVHFSLPHELNALARG